MLMQLVQSSHLELSVLTQRLGCPLSHGPRLASSFTHSHIHSFQTLMQCKELYEALKLNRSCPQEIHRLTNGKDRHESNNCSAVIAIRVVRASAKEWKSSSSYGSHRKRD